MHQRALWMLLLLPPLAWSLGCARPVFSEDGVYLPPPAGPGLVAQPRSPIPDVPMPVGFSAVASQSASHVEDGVRHVRHVYQGRGQSAEVVDFYRRHLPRHGWIAGPRQTQPDGAVVMRYVKGPEALRVRISRRLSVITAELTIAARDG